jgi:glucose-6-phosphate isomerase
MQQGKKNLMVQTTLWVCEPKNNLTIPSIKDNDDGLEDLANIELDKINKEVRNAVVKAHYEGGNPQIMIRIKDKSEEVLAELWYFFFLAVSLSGYLLDVNPYDQPGVEEYKKLLKENLEKLK